MDALLSLYSSIFESMPAPLCAVDNEGRILLVNPALDRLLGWELARVHQLRLIPCLQQAIVDPAQALCWTVALSEALSLGKTTFLNSLTDFCTKSASEPVVSLSGIVMPYYREDTELAGAFIIFHSESLTRSESVMRGWFLAAVSHELGTPLSNIDAAGALLARYLDRNQPEPWKLLHIIQTEVTRLQRLVAQFLSPASRYEVPTPASNVVTVRPLLHNVAVTFGVRRTGHDLVVQVPADLPFVLGDADLIQQILADLADNALHYALPGSQVTLAAQARPDDVLLCVTDQPTADGVWPLEPSQGVEGKAASAHRAGLGLSIASSLVRAMDGEIWCEKPASGGLRLCFTLPRAPDVADD